MHVVIWIAVGVLAGWAAGLLMKGRDFGVTGNLILGLIGSLVGGWVLALLGFNSPDDLLRHALVALLGAMLVLGVARRLRPVSRKGRKVLGEMAALTDVDAQFRKLGDLERRAWARLLKRDAKPRNPNVEFEEQMTFGQRVADRVATFGGSWTFIGIFLLAMLIWMMINTLTRRPFDPYPFILLNLVLSTLAAIQAPIIMMSQKRQEAKDRLRSLNDYQVNLKAELEIRHLHEKMDHLISKQWQRLAEIQQLQLEIMQQRRK